MNSRNSLNVQTTGRSWNFLFLVVPLLFTFFLDKIFFNYSYLHVSSLSELIYDLIKVYVSHVAVA